jgi:DNA invertase Pin-like site-specific DNA recombinase
MRVALYLGVSREEQDSVNQLNQLVASLSSIAIESCFGQEFRLFYFSL